MANGDKYGYFYESKAGDRKYSANSFSDWLAPFFSAGVFNGELQVTANDDMTVTLSAGHAWVPSAADTTKRLIHFAASQTFTLETASGTLDRIDTIVIRRDDTNRQLTAEYVTGGYAQNPIATTPTRSGAVYELVVAQIYVAAGSVSVTQENITDTRADSSLCGWVASTVKEIDFSQFTEQFNSFFQSYQARITKQFSAYLNTIAELENKGNVSYQEYLTILQNYESSQEKEFSDWFEGIKNKLSDDIAGNLQNQIDAINKNIGNAIQDLSTKLSFSNKSKSTGEIGIVIKNTTTGTETTTKYTEGGKVYLTEPGEYTVSASSDDFTVIPKTFTLDYTKTTETLDFTIYDANGYAYVGGYVGAFVSAN